MPTGSLPLLRVYDMPRLLHHLYGCHAGTFVAWIRLRVWFATWFWTPLHLPHRYIGYVAVLRFSLRFPFTTYFYPPCRYALPATTRTPTPRWFLRLWFVTYPHTTHPRLHYAAHSCWLHTIRWCTHARRSRCTFLTLPAGCPLHTCPSRYRCCHTHHRRYRYRWFATHLLPLLHHAFLRHLYVTPLSFGFVHDFPYPTHAGLRTRTHTDFVCTLSFSSRLGDLRLRSVDFTDPLALIPGRCYLPDGYSCVLHTVVGCYRRFVCPVVYFTYTLPRFPRRLTLRLRSLRCLHTFTVYCYVRSHAPYGLVTHYSRVPDFRVVGRCSLRWVTLLPLFVTWFVQRWIHYLPHAITILRYVRYMRYTAAFTFIYRLRSALPVRSHLVRYVITRSRIPYLVPGFYRVTGHIFTPAYTAPPPAARSPHHYTTAR